ncbi:MAG TPA: 2,3-dihydro-2,3-dihydroxybenzoate dehydrogenase [Planctomicrobium sp.]|nr:2,3-dihydro-2,3-dihydroxybenzoate dehydrogenase [Planctomicrobium sp.]
MKLTGFQDKVAFLTGATGGIGEALVQQLHESGAIVVATDFQRTVDSGTQESRLFTRSLDVRDSRAVDSLITDIEANIGPIEMGINVAGVLATGPVTETTDADWRHVFSVNLDGVFHVSRALARVMTPRRRGSIITVSSNAAGVPRHHMAAYAASKAASTMFTRCLGLELAPLGIRCNIVAPGSTLTPMQTGMWSDETGAQRVIAGFPEQYKVGIPLQKLATPEDIANAIMFLLSDQAGHIAMTDLYIDGGATLRA